MNKIYSLLIFFLLFMQWPVANGGEARRRLVVFKGSASGGKTTAVSQILGLPYRDLVDLNTDCVYSYQNGEVVFMPEVATIIINEALAKDYQPGMGKRCLPVDAITVIFFPFDSNLFVNTKQRSEKSAKIEDVSQKIWETYERLAGEESLEGKVKLVNIGVADQSCDKEDSIAKRVHHALEIISGGSGVED